MQFLTAVLSTALPSSSTSAYPPRPSPQTLEQKLMCMHWMTASLSYHAKSTDQLLAIIDSKDFRSQISGYPPVDNSSKDILSWITKNVVASHLFHTFEYNMIDYIVHENYPPNVWQAYLTNLSKGSKGQDEAETEIMKLKSFAKTLDPTPSEANNRPQYLSVNIWQNAQGQSLYGEISLVLKTTQREDILLSPVDTGGYTSDCLAPSKGPTCGPWMTLDYPLGTFTHINHIILQHQLYYNYSLAMLYRRMHGEKGQKDWYYHHYYEGLFMGTYFVEHVMFILSSFTRWGATKIQRLANATDRPLVWAGDYDSQLLDITVGRVAGVTWTNSDVEKFKHMFNASLKLTWDQVLKQTNSTFHLRLPRGTDHCGIHNNVVGYSPHDVCVYLPL